MTRAATPPNGVTGSPPAPAARRGDAIDHWLGMFTRFLRLPGEQSRAIRDELDSHMRERVRDLMLEGLSEDEGMRRAIEELGEAAELAAHFRAAHRPNRRLVMGIGAIGVAAGAAVVSIVAFAYTQSQPPRAAVQDRRLAAGVAPQADPRSYPGMAGNSDPAAGRGVPLLSDLPIVGKMFVSGNAASGDALAQPRLNVELSQTTLRDVAELIAKTLGKRAVFHTSDGFHPDMKIDRIALVETDVPTALRELNRSMQLTGSDAVDFRLRTDVLEVGPVRDFDRVEQTLVAYDLREAFSCDATTDELVSTLLQFVESDGWRENGGTTASLRVVGTKMFVEAPPRYHERVAWILSQFSGKANRSQSTKAPVELKTPPAASSAVELKAPEPARYGAMMSGGTPGGGTRELTPPSTILPAPASVGPAGLMPGGGSPTSSEQERGRNAPPAPGTSPAIEQTPIPAPASAAPRAAGM